jgi:putative membrane protein
VKYLKLLYALAGVALLAAIVIETDLGEVWSRIERLGWGAAAVLAIYMVYFSIDAFNWLVALPSSPLDRAWFGRLWKVRLVGEAFNAVMPAGGMGGEPVKAVLLKTRYGVDYRAGIASIIVAKTVNMIALIVFLSVGFALMVGSPRLPAVYKTVAGLGLGGVCLGTVIFFAIQRLKISSRAGNYVSARGIAGWLASVLHHVEDVEERFVVFYTRHRARFLGAAVLSLVNWIIGAVEVYAALWFLGHPVSFRDAWMIEAVAQMVRAATFFIPSSLGAQEGAFLFMVSALTGSPSLGVAVAVVRRFRELVWIGSGFLMGTAYSLTPAAARDAIARAERDEES